MQASKKDEIENTLKMFHSFCALALFHVMKDTAYISIEVNIRPYPEWIQRGSLKLNNPDEYRMD